MHGVFGVHERVRMRLGVRGVRAAPPFRTLEDELESEESSTKTTYVAAYWVNSFGTAAETIDVKRPRRSRGRCT